MWLNIVSVPLLLFAVTLVAHAQQCPDLYKRYSAEHTFCLAPNKACTIVKRGVTAKDKELILKLHNDYRSRVATGQETLAGGMPSAKNMLEMVWDDELAAVAQKLAETCKYGHDCNNCRKVKAFSVGQNIGKSYGLSSAPEAADWQKFIKNLYDEVAVFNKKFIQPYVPGPNSPTRQYGHFTQMVWATSWKIGCGWTVFKEGNSFTSYTVCNYGPSGNLRRGEMYKAGQTCSECPKNSCCGNQCRQHRITSNYPGLCKVIDTTSPPEGPGPHGGKHIFFCDFSKQPDCAMTVTGKAWTTVQTAGGNWLSVVLNGGERTKVTFNRKFPTKGDFCVKVVIRSGPNVDGQSESGQGVSYLDAGFYKADYDLDFAGVPKELRQNFMPHLYGFNAGEAPIQFIFEYSVPPRSSPQFVEIKEISVQEGQCVL